MKKLLAFVLVLALSMLSTISASALSTSTVINTQEKIEYLISQGISEDFLEGRDAQQIDELYRSLYGETINFLGTTTSSLSETIFSPETSMLGAIPESDMLLKLTACEVVRDYGDGSRNKITMVFVIVDYEWYGSHPFVNREDKVSVNWDSSLFTFEAKSFSSEDYKKSLGSGEWVKKHSGTYPAEVNQGGLGYDVQLEIGHFGQKGTAMFTLLPKYTIYEGTSRMTDINVQYVHNRDLISSLGFSAAGVGVTIVFTNNSDSTTATANPKYSV